MGRTIEQQLFDTVYAWGRVGIVVDHTAPTYLHYLKKLKKKYSTVNKKGTKT